MPQAIIPAVLAGVASGVTVTGVGIGFALTTAGFLTAAGGSLLVSAANMVLTKKPKSRASAVSAAAGITTTVRQSNATRTVVYGHIRVGGTILFAGSTNNNSHLHLVVALAGHKLFAIDEILLDDISIPPDAINAAGEVTTGKLAGYCRIVKHLGDEAQAADAYMVAEVPGWTTAHRLRGIAYLYIRLIYNADRYPSGLPNVSAVVRGRKVMDTRDGILHYSLNPALIVRDFLASSDFGFEAEGAIDDESVSAAANVCDEVVDTTPEGFEVASVNPSLNRLVMTGANLKLCTADRVQVSSTGTLPGGVSAGVDYYVAAYQFRGTPQIRLATTVQNAMSGIVIDLTTAGSGVMTVTKTGEPRYSAACVLERDSSLGDNLLALLTAMGGRAVYAGGLWRIGGAAYATPVVTLDENDLGDALTVSTKIRRSERFNSIKGLYYSHINNWQSADYPQMTDDAAVGRDGIQIVRDYDLPATFRPWTAQRLAKVELKKAAQEITVDAVCNLKALQLQCGDAVAVNNTRLGWASKVFEVVDLAFTYASDRLAVQLTLRETAAEIYDWATDEESDTDPAPNSNLPTAFEVGGVTGLGFGSTRTNTDGGDTLYGIYLQWDAHPDAFVSEGGQFEIQYKLTVEASWRPSRFVNGSLTRADIAQAEIGESYDVRIRAVNGIGVRSDWASLTGVISGSSGGVGTTDDWGAVTGGVTTTDDWGAVTGSVTTTDDWGGI